MEILKILLSSALGFFVGYVMAKISSNSQNDNQCRADNIKLIDLLVDQYNIYLNSEKKQIQFNEIRFDYQVRSLIDDTTLLPIIGRSVFDNEYTNVIAKMAALSEHSPGMLNKSEKDELAKNMSSLAIDLKKMINIDRGRLRIFSRS